MRLQCLHTYADIDPNEQRSNTTTDSSASHNQLNVMSSTNHD